MKPTQLWTVFILAFGLVTLGMTVHAGIKIYHYVRLSESTSALSHQFEAVHLGKDAYTLEGQYIFKSSVGLIQGSSRLNDLRVRSRAGIDATCDRAQGAEWTVWYRPNNPMISSLEHVFPWRASVYAIMLLLSLGYIIIMSRVIHHQRIGGN